LEAVTSRLEDLYDRDSKYAGNGASQPSNVSTSTITVPAAVSPYLLLPPAPVQAQVIEDPPSVTAYDEQILKGRVQPFVELTEKLAIASVVEQVGRFPFVVSAQRLTAQVLSPCRPGL
jgi:adenylyl cyclase-associated protein